jgi:hypothetical protein
MAQFKDMPDDDAYQALFDLNRDALQGLPTSIPPFERHGIYVSFPLEKIKPFVDAYFHPSKPVLEFEEYLISSYKIDPEKLIVLCYRGTDKSIEVPPAPIEKYIEVAQQRLKEDPSLQVLVQTDQQQAIDAVRSAIPQAIVFAELPATDSKLAIHNLPVEGVFGVPRSELAKRLLGVTHLMSRAKVIVTHTGNMAAWIALYRGRNTGLYQFDSQAALRDPHGELVLI